MALWGGPPKGALYWGGHNLVNFLSLAPPGGYVYVITELFPTGALVYVFGFLIYFVRALVRRILICCCALTFLNMAISKQTQLLLYNLF